MPIILIIFDSAQKEIMKVTVRLAKIEDVSEILEIVNHAIQNTTANYDYEPHTLEQKRKWFKDKKEAKYPIFVAVDEGKICGFGTYGPFRFKYGYRYTVEHSVYVHYDYYGNGIGSILLEKLIENSKNQGYHLMIGGIDATNLKSIAFHEKFGFEKCGIIKEVAFKFEKWLDLQFMSKKLI